MNGPVYINGIVSQIYLITNTLNGKKYIGQTTYAMKERFRHHSKTNSPLGEDIRKLGTKNFSIMVLADNIPSSELNNMEKFYISEYASQTEGYNISPGGQIMAVSSRKKLSHAKIGLTFTDIHKPVNNKSKGIRKPSRCKPVKGTHLLTGETIYLSSMSADDRFDVRLISAVCKGKRDHHRGYKWEYVQWPK